jgi:hypothetical protein
MTSITLSKKAFKNLVELVKAGQTEKQRQVMKEARGTYQKYIKRGKI